MADQFFTSFGASIAGMFGFGSLVQSQTPMAKVQGQIAAANSKINSIYQTGLLLGVQDNQKLIEQLNALTMANLDIANLHTDYTATVSEQNNSIQMVHSVVLSFMLLTVISYLMYVPTPK